MGSLTGSLMGSLTCSLTGSLMGSLKGSLMGSLMGSLTCSFMGSQWNGAVSLINGYITEGHVVEDDILFTNKTSQHV